MRKKEALKLLKEEGCSENVIKHVLMVSRNALRVARRVNENGGQMDERVVEIGGLLHDIGRSKTNSVLHGIEGARILKKHGVHPIFIEICENHLGAGIDKKEAEKLGLPKRDYLPKTKEGRLIAYIDNLVEDSKIISFNEALKDFKKKIKNEGSIRRFIKMNKEFGKYL